MSLLAIVRKAYRRLGVSTSVPNAVLNSAEEAVAIMGALAEQEGRELARRFTWQRLIREQSFTTVAQESQTGAVPSDFDRMIPDTCWNYTENEPMLGPLEPAEWQALKAGLVGPPDLYFRILGNAFLIIPTPEAGETIKYEYVSKWWIDTDGDGVPDASEFAADTDEPLLDEECMVLGVMWRWLKRNRLPYADEFQEYKVAVDQLASRDGVRKTLHMGGGAESSPRIPRVPDGSWNL